MRRFGVLTATTLAVVALAWTTSLATAQQTLTYGDLVNRMIDLEHLATLPGQGETCQQWSSYDRASQYDAATGKYVGWAANGDGGQFIRAEGEQIVMAEMEGPGCIFRIWSAMAKQGHVKIYLDGQAEPTIDMPFIDYFTGTNAPLNYPAMSYEMKEQGNRGENLYLPIPYQKSCKIVADKGWGAYYHFTYTTFPKGTKVPTFQGKLSGDDAAALKKLDGYLKSGLGTDPAGRRQGEETVDGVARVGAGESLFINLEGPRAITAIKGNMKFADREDEMAALREMVLRITFDGAREPAVWCPLGDFFGTAPGVNPYRSLVTGMTEDGAYAYWYMPFGRNAKRGVGQ